MLVELSMVEQRYEAVMAVLRDGEPVTEVAARLEVNRSSVHRWIARYQAGGLGALADRSHRDRPPPHRGPLADDHRQDRALPPHPSQRVPRWSRAALQGRGPSRPRRVGCPLQHRHAPPVARHAHAEPTVRPTRRPAAPRRRAGAADDHGDAQGCSQRGHLGLPPGVLRRCRPLPQTRDRRDRRRAPARLVRRRSRSYRSQNQSRGGEEEASTCQRIASCVAHHPGPIRRT